VLVVNGKLKWAVIVAGLEKFHLIVLGRSSFIDWFLATDRRSQIKSARECRRRSGALDHGQIIVLPFVGMAQ
jgi:hypothetical protein